MFPIVRMYASAQTAQQVADTLAGEERVASSLDRTIKPFSPTVLAPGKDNAAVVRKAVDDGVLAAAFASVCTAGLERGRHIVVVSCAFGSGRRAEQILDANGPVDEDRIPDYSDNSVLLLSDFMGIPTLWNRKTPLSDLLGFAAVSHGTVMGGGTSNFSFSGMLGLPLLTKSGPLFGGSVSNFSFSGMFGIPTVIEPKADTSLGFPTLSKNPTPLSSTLGMPTLTDEKRAE